MKAVSSMLRTLCLAACVALPALQASAQESSAKAGNMMAEIHPMAKDAMDMKKAKEMASPSMVQKAKEQMMTGDTMAKAMAMEASMAMAMKDDKTMKMVQAQTMAPMPEGKPMISDEKIKAAFRKVFSDPVQFQALLQTLIMRETAANMMANADKPATEAMMIPENDMKAAKTGMMSDEDTTMKVAKEMMMNAMMMDKDISMAVKGAAMKPSDPAMEKMMKSDSMMMAKTR